MNISWLNKRGNKNCILYFNGWAEDENAVNHLDAGDFDICMFNDYNPVSPIDEKFDDYSTIYLVAWSLGVWAAAKLLSQSQIKITKAIALNGTQQPIDINRGISPSVFKATLDTWNGKNRNKFNIRMLGGRKQYAQLINRISTREVENQKSELSNILKEVSSNKAAEIRFDCALIGSNDLIFTPANQFNYWNAKARIVETDVPHYPFAVFETWNEIIGL